MKTILLAVGTMILAGVGWRIVTHSSHHIIDIEATAAFDVTDPMLAQPIVSDILSNVGLKEDKWLGVQINTTVINGYDYNPLQSAVLAQRHFLLANPKERNKEVQLFNRELIANVETIKKQASMLPQSSIYKYLISESTRLSRSAASKKKFFIYSDLQENSALFSVYKQKDFLLLKNHPDKVKELFLNFEKPANLQGVEMHFIFQAQSLTANENFSLMSHLMKKIFTDAGAKVWIEANLIVSQQK